MAFPKSLVIVPTYNEKENILLIMSAILEQNECLEILVVDDGSPDGTGDLVQAEAINDLINASTKESKNVALLSLSGQLHHRS